MSEVFADTSGWASAFVRTETYHVMAADYLRQWQSDGTLVVTTNYVLNEVSALLTSPLRVPRPQQIALLNSIRTASWVEVVHIDPALDAAARSLVVMEQRGITSGFTNDHHFEQAGLMRLLR